MSDGNVPAWGNGGGDAERRLGDWRRDGQEWVQGALGSGAGRAGAAREVEQIAQRLTAELERAHVAVEQAQAVAAAADQRAETALADARAVREAVDELRAQVAGRQDTTGASADATAQPEPDRVEQAPASLPVAGAVGQEPGAPGGDVGDAAPSDPLVAALTHLADDLMEAADARARGELDARAALRLLRAGFHTAQRTLSRVQRDELRGGRSVPPQRLRSDG